VNFHSFKLDSRLMRGIIRAGYVTPTPVQEKAIPPAMAGHDIIGTAQTGTGKTAAFVLPILHKLLARPGQRTRALIVTPTRELAEQIHKVIRELGTDSGIRSATVYGGVSAAPQLRALRSGVEILIACPGRLLDHIRRGHANLDEVEIVVLDEADRMLDMGFLPDVRRILKHVSHQRQMLLFSATFPGEIERLASKTMTDPKRIAIGISQPVHTVSHALFPVDVQFKTPLLLSLLKQTETGPVLVFTRTKRRAERLSRQIGRAGHRVISLHGDRSQAQRRAALEGFRDGRFRIMVATDLAARGLDIEGISHVVNYDMPNTADDYIHRIGRTGRADRTGDAFTFVTPRDDDTVKAVEQTMGKPLPRKKLPDFNHAEAVVSPPSIRTRPKRRAVSAKPPNPTSMPPKLKYGRNARRFRGMRRFATR